MNFGWNYQLNLPVIRMMKGARWEAALAVALLFAVPMNCGHLVPNPVMPDAVRLAHLIETAPSNFTFGALVTAVLLWWPAGLASRPALSGTQIPADLRG